MVEIDADDEGPAEAVIVVDNAGTRKDNRLVDVTFVVDGDFYLYLFMFSRTLEQRLRSPFAISSLGAMLTSIWYTIRMQRACAVLLHRILITLIVVY